MSHEFVLPIHELDAAGRDFHFPVRAAWLRGALEGTDVRPASADGVLDVRLSKSGTDVVVRATLRAELTVACARCLAPATVAVQEQLSVLAVPTSQAARGRKTPAESEQELASDEADVIAYEGETVVLDDLVRDELLLGIPMIPLCSEACPGISPGSARDSSDARVDPRLRPLLRLKKT